MPYEIKDAKGRSMMKIEDFLIAQGFKEDSNGDSNGKRFFVRLDDEVTHCECNEKSPLIQVVVYDLSRMNNGLILTESLVVELFGYIKGLWFTSQIQVSPDMFIARYDDIFNTMVDLWETFVNGINE